MSSTRSGLLARDSSPRDPNEPYPVKYTLLAMPNHEQIKGRMGSDVRAYKIEVIHFEANKGVFRLG
ncbi:hypothetical protein M1146_04485 [Patescibacteria group bacterium]|nr:hypothetical protein [Patescibacteria group bacterium]